MKQSKSPPGNNNDSFQNGKHNGNNLPTPFEVVFYNGNSHGNSHGNLQTPDHSNNKSNHDHNNNNTNNNINNNNNNNNVESFKQQRSSIHNLMNPINSSVFQTGKGGSGGGGGGGSGGGGDDGIPKQINTNNVESNPNYNNSNTKNNQNNNSPSNSNNSNNNNNNNNDFTVLQSSSNPVHSKFALNPRKSYPYQRISNTFNHTNNTNNSHNLLSFAPKITEEVIKQLLYEDEKLEMVNVLHHYDSLRRIKFLRVYLCGRAYLVDLGTFHCEELF
jgi:hypothetical protein